MAARPEDLSREEPDQNKMRNNRFTDVREEEKKSLFKGFQIGLTFGPDPRLVEDARKDDAKKRQEEITERKEYRAFIVNMVKLVTALIIVCLLVGFGFYVLTLPAPTDLQKKAAAAALTLATAAGGWLFLAKRNEDSGGSS